MPELRVRAGVLTGNAAVEVGAEGEGMVLGDTVNTASRLQSIAAPGTVLVDDVTRRASEAAIAYEDAGAARGQGPRAARARVDGAPGRGRRPWRPAQGRTRGAVRGPREGARSGSSESLRGERRAQSGAPGDGGRRGGLGQVDACCGSSPSTWTGLSESVRWHQGRCLSYGEGRRLLGAGGDGPRAGRDRRGGGSRLGARETLRGGRAVRDRRARAAAGRAAARAPAGARAADGFGSRRPVQRLATVL